MKWLIIQSDGEHKGQDSWAPNWFLRECYGLQDALIRHGQLAHVWGIRHANFEWYPDFSAYDYILIAENYEMNWIYRIPDLYPHNRKGKVIQWVIDLHCQPHTVYTEVKADIYLHATRSLIAEFQQFAPSARHIWFPNAIDDRYFRHLDSHRDIDALFIGGGGTRQHAIDRMVRETGMTYLYGVTGYEYIRMMRRAKIAFNAALNGDLNYRTFEAIALGACLLCPADPCLEELGFAHMENCLIYYNMDEAVALANRALKDHLWSGIGFRGALMAHNHTYEQRICSLLKQL